MVERQKEGYESEAIEQEHPSSLDDNDDDDDSIKEEEHSSDR